eukprot:m.205186 g.205186  ORF g.205186 m.205186 type:complete len:793 (+) comp22852_c0_seq1:20-2398(+)
MQPSWTGDSRRGITGPSQGELHGSTPGLQRGSQWRNFGDSSQVLGNMQDTSRIRDGDPSKHESKEQLKEHVSKFTTLRDEYDRELSVQKEWRSKIDLEMKRLLEYIAVVKGTEDDNRKTIETVVKRAREDKDLATRQIRQLEKELDELKDANAEQEEKLNESKAALSKETTERLANDIRLNEQLEAKTADLEAARKEITMKSTELVDMSTEVSLLTTENDKLITASKALKTRNADLNSALETAEERREAASRRASDAEARATENAEAMSALEDALKATRSAATTAADNQQKELDDMARRLDDSRASLNDMKAALDDAKAEVDTLRDSLNHAQSDKNKLGEELKSFNDKYAEETQQASEKLAQAEKLVEDVTVKAASARDTMRQDHAMKVQELEETIESLTTEMENLKSSAATEAKQAESTIADLRLSVQRLEDAKTELTTEVASKSSAEAALASTTTSTITDLEAKLADALKRAADAEAQVTEQGAADEAARQQATDAAVDEAKKLSTKVRELEAALLAKSEESKAALRQIGQELAVDSQRRLMQVESQMKESVKEAKHWKAECVRLSSEAAAAATAAHNDAVDTHALTAWNPKATTSSPSVRAKRVRHDPELSALDLSPIQTQHWSPPSYSSGARTPSVRRNKSTGTMRTPGHLRTPHARPGHPKSSESSVRSQRPLKHKSVPSFAEASTHRQPASPTFEVPVHKPLASRGTPQSRRPTVQRRGTAKQAQTPKSNRGLHHTPKSSSRGIVKKNKQALVKSHSGKRRPSIPMSSGIMSEAESVGDPSDVFAF